MLQNFSTSRIAVLALVLLLVGSPGALFAADERSGEGSVKPAPESGESSGAGTEETSQGRAEQNIRVHGHWTITVLDPDGGVVLRREFDNALDPNGDLKLFQFLARQTAVGYWSIFAGTPAGQEVCEEPAGAPTGICVVTEPTDPTVGNNRFPTLSLTVKSTAPRNMTLSGTFIAQRSGSIDQVDSVVFSCTPATTPNDCATGINPLGGFSAITTTGIAPVPVVLGQQVVISVEISLS